MGSNYLDNAIDDEYEENDADFIGNEEEAVEAIDGQKKKGCPCHELKKIAWYKSDCHERNLHALAVHFNMSINQV